MLKRNSFFYLFWTQFFGAFNDNLFKNALILLITFKTYTIANLSSAQTVALCSGLFILPFFLASTLAGQISDSTSKEKLIRVIKFFEILIMTLGAISFISENLPFLILTLFLMGLQSTFFGPSKYSIIPDLVEPSHLLKSNSIIEMGTFVAILTGSILAELLLRDSSQGNQWVATGVITFAGLGFLSSLGLKPKPNLGDLRKDKLKLKASFKDIFAVSVEKRIVWMSLLGMSWFWFFGAALLTLFPIFVRDTIGGKAEIVTLIFSVFSIGVALGSLSCKFWVTRVFKKYTVLFGFVISGIACLDIYLTSVSVSTVPLTVKQFLSIDNSIRLVFDFFVLSYFTALYKVPLNTLIQTQTQANKRSRVVAGNNILNALFMVISSLVLMGLFSTSINPQEILGALGILNIGFGVFLLFFLDHKRELWNPSLYDPC